MAENRPLAVEEITTPFPPSPDDRSPTPLETSEGNDEDLSTGHSLSYRRGISAHIISKIPFMRSNGSLEKISTENGAEPLHQSGSMAAVQQNSKARKRKGSLRKTALLGKGVLGRDRKASDAKARSPLSSPHSAEGKEKEFPITSRPDSQATPRPSVEDEKPTLSISPPKWLFPTSKTSLSSLRSSLPSIDPASSRASITSPTVPTDHSTTDEEEQRLTSPKLPFVSSARKPPSSSGDSYFPPQPSFRSRRATNRTKSPLATQPQSPTSSPVASDDEWDYTETAYWGYVILIITWLVFVVGIGSCFDVWSWAWDVGETPYAPPELNDDPTLPIVGYYPALIVLTCVMAWIWVVIAWVGMKYFRHAEGKDDDDD